jgi:thiamine monophosphate synthase
MGKKQREFHSQLTRSNEMAELWRNYANEAIDAVVVGPIFETDVLYVVL